MSSVNAGAAVSPGGFYAFQSGNTESFVAVRETDRDTVEGRLHH